MTRKQLDKLYEVNGLTESKRERSGTDYMYDYIQYPPTIKKLAYEIKRVLDDYFARRIDNAQVKECILFWASSSPEKLFNANDINNTIKLIIGVKRLSVLNKLLEDYQVQISMFTPINKKGGFMR